MTAQAIQSTCVDTPPLRAVNEITTIQKYGRMIGTDTTSRNVSSAVRPMVRFRRALPASAAQL